MHPEWQRGHFQSSLSLPAHRLPGLAHASIAVGHRRKSEVEWQGKVKESEEVHSPCKGDSFIDGRRLEKGLADPTNSRYRFRLQVWGHIM